MAQHGPWGEWEYDLHPARSTVTKRCRKVTRFLQAFPRALNSYGFDTRRAHGLMFRRVAPLPCPCFAGNYRGFHACGNLRVYRVHVRNDPKVGVKPETVAMQIRKFEKTCRELTKKHESWLASEGNKAPPEAALMRFVILLAKLLDTFLQIHPYANGNGHAARLMVWVLMCRYGFTPASMPLDGRANYYDQLYRHRRGDPVPLQEFLLDAIIGGAQGATP